MLITLIYNLIVFVISFNETLNILAVCVCENFKVFQAKVWMPPFPLIRIQNSNYSTFFLDVIQSYKDKHNENRSILQFFEAYMVWRGLNCFYGSILYFGYKCK